jgi:hypothetical protein
MPRSVLYDRANERSGGSEVTQTEKHIVGEHESGWIFTSEVPLQEAPSSVTVTGSTGDWTEVTDGTPATKEYDVAYDIATPESRAGAIKFNSSDDGEAVTIVYEGRGTKPFAGMFNDLQRIVGPWSINLPKAVADTPDDDFDASSLDGKWTAVNGSSGTVSLTGTSGAIYQLFPDQSLLAIQVDNGSLVNLRQDYTLADGKSLILAMNAALVLDGQSGISNNELRVGLYLNSDNAGPETGSHTGIVLDADADGWRIAAPNGFNSTPVSGTAPGLGDTIYLRILRAGLVYHRFFSLSGLVWVPMGGDTEASALDNVWIATTSAAAFGTPKPIITFPWIREGSNGLFPW